MFLEAKFVENSEGLFPRGGAHQKVSITIETHMILVKPPTENRTLEKDRRDACTFKRSGNLTRKAFGFQGVDN
jgi:hypothetical protein